MVNCNVDNRNHKLQLQHYSKYKKIHELLNSSGRVSLNKVLGQKVEQEDGDGFSLGHLLCTAVVVSDPWKAAYGFIILKGQSNEIFDLQFFHNSNLPGPLTNELKYF